MSPRIFTCPICGWIIWDEEGSVSWMNEFRGLYSSSEEGIVLTGVGLYSEPQSGAFIAPPDPKARWDDPGYESPEEDQFGAMSQQEVNGRRGFVIHDACWSLIEHFYHPVSVPCERLLDVLGSLPMYLFARGLDWDHDYGALARLNDERHYFPWEGRRFSEKDFEEGEFNTIYCVNPLAISEVEEILRDAPHPPPSRDSLTSAGPSSVRDPFNSLPEELCTAVAIHLPTPDAFNARLASRSFLHIFNSPQFWASRFQGKCSERSWLFEAVRDLARPGGVGRRDWRWLFRRTVDARLAKGAQNRKRIWSLICQVAEILELYWCELPSSLPPPWQFPSSVEEEDARKPPWVLAAGNIKGWGLSFSPMEAGCARFKTQRVAIPSNGIAQVAASIVRLGRSVYIAGLSLTATNGEVLRLGYRTAESGPAVQLQGSVLTGFNLAVGLGGIQALQCVGRTNTTESLSGWLGSPKDVPRTERLSVTANGPSLVLEFGFDGLRMVSLASLRQQKPRIVGDGTNDHNGLRHSAIWYPDVPPRTVSLNESFLVEPEVFMSGYKPLFWTCFGGPGGIFLPRLVQIRIVGFIDRIDFFLDTPEVPMECRSFGRYGGSQDIEDEDDDIVKLSIDGPGGEIIDRVEICQALLDEAEWVRREGYLSWLKIHTNRGRACEAGQRRIRGKHRLVVKEITASPGTAITGFYGVRYSYLAFSLPTLGVITEPLRKTR